MLLNKFPLHLQLNTSFKDEDVVMRDSLGTPIGTPTGVSTPTEQVNFNNLQWFNEQNGNAASAPNPPKYGRTGSTSSIASSVSNFSTCNNDFSYSNFASHYKLTDLFENLLLETYLSYQMNPTITPFNESNPPYGVINKVSKDALQKAMDENIEIGIEVNNYSLTIIRQKLIQICQQNSSTTPTGSRQNSFQGALNLQTKFNQIPSGVSTPNNISTTPMNEYFNFELPPQPPQQQQQLQQPFPLQPQYQPQYQSPYQPQPQPQPQPQAAPQLQPSFELHHPRLERSDSNASAASPLIPELFNATSNRKRESLRLKRSGNKIVYN